MRIDPGDEKPAGAAGHGHFRASHADRDQVIDTLKVAFVQGRLTLDELELRAGQALASRTYAELAALTGDIPAGAAKAQRPRTPARAPGQVAKAATCVSLALVLLVAAVVAGQGNDLERLIEVAVFFLPVCGLSLGGLLMFHSWLENRSRGQLPRGPASGVGGSASQRALSATGAGSPPPIGQVPPHSAEAAPSRPQAPAIARRPATAPAAP